MLVQVIAVSLCLCVSFTRRYRDKTAELMRYVFDTEAYLPRPILSGIFKI